jgi:hypothetical protein
LSFSFGAGARARRYTLIYGDGDWWYDPASNEFGYRFAGREALEWADMTWEFSGPDEYPELASRVAPSWFAKSGEKALHAVGGQHPQYRNTADVLAGLISLSIRRTYAAELLARSVKAGFEPRDDPFIRKYLPSAGIDVPIAPGVSVSLPIMQIAVALTVAEVRQADGDQDAAIEVLLLVERTTHVRLSLVELLNAVGRFEESVEFSDHTSNDDDVTAMILAYRAIALREIGRTAEARSTLVRLLSEGTRSGAVTAFARVVSASMDGPAEPADPSAG